MRILNWLTALFIILVACDEGKTQPPPPANQIVRLEITPAGVLLTKVGESQILSAKAFDAQGFEVKTSFTWTSSNPANVTVDSSGIVTASSDLGSAQILVQAQTVQAVPVMVAVAKPVLGAVLVSDAQVVTDPVPLDLNARPTIGTQSKVVLKGIDAPTPGTVLLSSQAKPVAGKVISSTVNGDNIDVVLERRPVTELFERILIRASGSLAGVKPVFEPDTAPQNVTTLADGTMKLTYKNIKSSREAAISTEFGFFGKSCKTKGSIDFNAAEFSVTISHSLNFDFVLDSDFLIVNQLRIKANGSLGLSMSGGLKLTGTLKGEVSCKKSLFNIPIPVTGFLAGIIAPVIPLGAKISLGGDVTVTALELSGTGALSLNAALGFDFTPETGFTNLSAFEPSASLSPTILIPGFQDLQVRGTATGFLGVTGGIGVGNVIAALEIIAGSMGPTLKAKLATPTQQVLDPEFAANYALNFSLKVGLGKEIEEALSTIFSNNNAALIAKTVSLNFSDEIALTSSPTAEGDKIKANKERFKAGEKVSFAVTLDPANLNFIGFYNVEKICLMRKIDSIVNLEDCVPASNGQKNFTIEWTAPDKGLVGENFFAFVYSVLPFIPMELGNTKKPPPPTIDSIFVRPQTITASDSFTTQTFTFNITPKNSPIESLRSLAFLLPDGGSATDLKLAENLVFDIEKGTMIYTNSVRVRCSEKGKPTKRNTFLLKDAFGQVNDPEKSIDTRVDYGNCP